MTDADTHRATPGYVYGVGIHSSSTKPAEYDCACPCHKAGPDARSVYCSVCHRGTMSTTPKTATHEQAVFAGQSDPYPWRQSVPDYYFVTKGNTLKDELEEHFPTSEKAQTRAAELNERDVIKERRLTKKQETRARRLRDLNSGGYWRDEFSWIQKLERYAVASWWDAGSDTIWDTVATLADVEKELHDQSVERVVDLDTGADVPFTRQVTVTLVAGL